MASKNTASLALFLGLNLLFFSLVSACGSCSNPPNPRPNPTPSPSGGGSCSNPPNPRPNPTPSPSGGGSCSNPPNPTPNPTPSPSGGGSCPRDALKLGVCANVLGLVNATVGSPPVTPCCTLIQGLADLEAAVCLCTVIKANILGINLNIPVSLSLLLNVCSRSVPRGFQCA